MGCYGNIYVIERPNLILIIKEDVPEALMLKFPGEI